MNKRCFVICVLTWIGSFCSSHAVDLVQFPLGNLSWTVDVTYPGAGSSTGETSNGSARPLKASITLVDDIRYTQITWSNGKVTNRWSLKNRGFTVTDSPANNSIYVLPSTSPLLSTYGSIPSDAADFKWVTPGDLVSPDPISYHEKSCLHYKGSATVTLSAGRTVTEKAEAWIDKNTLLPVVLQEGDVLYAFTFLPEPPSAPLVMPPNFQAALDRVLAAATSPRVIGAYR
jgi:hypothetical protein